MVQLPGVQNDWYKNYSTLSLPTNLSVLYMRTKFFQVLVGDSFTIFTIVGPNTIVMKTTNLIK